MDRGETFLSSERRRFSKGAVPNQPGPTPPHPTAVATTDPTVNNWLSRRSNAFPRSLKLIAYFNMEITKLAKIGLVGSK